MVEPVRTKDQFKNAYHDGRILATKIDVHTRYSSIPIDITAAITRKHPEIGVADLLDIGCGTGDFLTHLVQQTHDGRLAGLDLVPPQQPHPDWTFTEGDAESLPYDDDSFDAVTCLHTLSHITNLPAAMAEAQRVLRPGGVYIATANSLGSYPHVSRYRQRAHTLLGWGEPMFTTTAVNAENLPQILAPHWHAVTVDTLDGQLQIPLETFGTYFAANIPTWQQQPDKEQRAHIRKWITAWTAGDQIDGHIVEPKQVGLAFCRPR